MKKIFIMMVTLFAINCVYGQTLIAEYDFEKQVYNSTELKPKHKQPVVLKIININKIANSVQITSNDVKINDDFLDPKEEQIKNILAEVKPAEEIKPTIELPVDIDNYSKLKEISDNSSKNNLKTNELKKELASKNKKINELISTKNNNDILIAKLNYDLNLDTNKFSEELKKVALPNTVEKITEKHTKISSQLSTKIANLTSDNSKVDEKILNLKIERDEIQKNLDEVSESLGRFKNMVDSLNASYVNFKKELVEINRINSAYSNYIDYVINPNLTRALYQSQSDSICSILKSEKRSDYYYQITEFDNKYSQFIARYNDLFNDMFFLEINKEDPNYAKLVKAKFDIMKKDVEVIYNKVDITDLRKKMNNVEIIDSVLSTEKAFTIVSDPVQPLEDYVEFKVKIKQSRVLGSSMIRENDRDFTYLEYVRNGVRWDVSVGPVFDFGIKNQEYEIQKTDKNKYKIIANNISQFTPTVAGMLHTSFRTNNMFAFGFTLGVSINVTDLNFNSFFPGVSLLIGKREKIVFTAGPAFKKVNQLKKIYKENETIDEQIQVTDLTSEQYKIGFFFGLSYNLTSKQKSRVKTLK
ncbi:MAG: hypothetical protein U0X58_13225 [Flavobacteriaceae bacterium]